MNAESIQLVERAQLNDAAAFAQLVGAYRRMCLSVAFKVLRDATAANDVSQDAFIKAWMRLADLREPRRFGTWLCGIARNLAVDRLRRRRSAEQLSSDTLPAKTSRWTIDPIDDVCRRESYELVNGAMEGLDEIARTALTLRYYDKMPSKQIAQKLGISADAVDMRLIRARKRLRMALSNITAA